MKIVVSMVTFLMTLTAAISGQDVVRTGDEVQFSCTRMTSGWCSGRVEAVNGNSVRVKWGNMRDQFSVVTRDQIRVPAKPDSPQTTAFQEVFAAEVGTHQRNALRIFAHFYSPDEFFNSRGTPTTAAGWTELMGRLAEVDALCKGKYRGMTNRTPSVVWPGPRKGDLDARYGEWCKIADQRLTFEPRVRADAAKYMIGLSAVGDIVKAIEDRLNHAGDDTQQVLYEPVKWKAGKSVELQKSFAEYGTPMPSDFFNELDSKAAELRSIIEKTAPAKTFVRPGNSDAAVEAVVKRQIVKDYPGTQMLDIGGDYPKWERREGADLIRSDTDVKIYKLTVNYYKRGYALVKMPNRPYCQKRSWIVRQAGMAVNVGQGGEFMKCQ